MNPLDFENFYNTVLLPSMEQLKKQSNASDGWGIKGVIAVLIAIGCGLLAAAGYVPGEFAGFIAICTLVFITVSVYMYTKKKDLFTANYKQLVIKKMVEYIDPGFVYKADGSVTAQEYVNSSLIRYRYTYFNGEDYIEGKYNGVSFHCSDITTENDEDKKIFNGLFMVIKINDAYQCGTYVWTRGFEQLAASRMDQYYRLIPMAEVYDVNVGDPNFTHYFRVCATYSGEALSILSDNMRTGLIKLIEYMNRPIGISFVMGYCYVAIPFDEDLFDAGDYYADDKDVLKRHFATIALIPAIINDLRLFDLQ